MVEPALLVDRVNRLILRQRAVVGGAGQQIVEHVGRAAMMSDQHRVELAAVMHHHHDAELDRGRPAELLEREIFGEGVILAIAAAAGNSRGVAQ